MSTLIVAPMAREARLVGARACGAGREARAQSERLLREATPTALVLLGVCGALDPSLVAGHIIVARAVIGQDGVEHTPDARLFDAARHALQSSGARFVSSRVITVDRPLVSREDRTRAWNDAGAGGIDMESADVARAAEAHGVPWLVVRAVSDTAGQAIPRQLAGWSTAAEPRILRQVALSPASWPALAGLALGWRQASRALRTAAAVLLPAVERVSAASADPSQPLAAAR